MNQSVEHKIDLKIDFREQRSGIIEEIGKISDRLTVELCTLKTGDYILGDQLIIERKTFSDFMVSIKTGRLFQQAYRIAETGKNGLIILESDKTVIDNSLMSREALLGTFIHLTVFTGIPVIRSRNIQETAAILIAIVHQTQKLPLPRQKHILSGNRGQQINKKQRSKLFLIQNIPGIGIKKGLALLRHFSTIEKMVGASPEDLIKVRGIGHKLACSIFAILHEPY